MDDEDLIKLLAETETVEDSDDNESGENGGDLESRNIDDEIARLLEMEEESDKKYQHIADETDKNTAAEPDETNDNSEAGDTAALASAENKKTEAKNGTKKKSAALEK
ncbi:MAG: hypothetical protein FWE82_07535, partial [Defluviitaleaceae bacterium]|nr:hypothetical protein [Defluviitaleaceae bacterium]